MANSPQGLPTNITNHNTIIVLCHQVLLSIIASFFLPPHIIVLFSWFCKDVAKWTVADVCSWTTEFLEKEYVDILNKQKVDGEVLGILTKADFVQHPYNLPGGPAAKLVARFQALIPSKQHFIIYPSYFVFFLILFRSYPSLYPSHPRIAPIFALILIGTK